MAKTIVSIVLIICGVILLLFPKKKFNNPEIKSEQDREKIIKIARTIGIGIIIFALYLLFVV